MRKAPDRCLPGRGSRACLLFLLLYACSCAHLPAPTPSKHLGAEGSTGRCAAFFADLDDAVKSAGVRDAGAFRVQGYPYLRTSRFLAAFRHEIEGPAMFTAWVDRLQELDRRARQHEIQNLPSAGLDALPCGGSRAALMRRVQECGNALRETDFRDVRTRSRLRHRVRAPDEYIFLRRAGGLYPVTSLFVLRGVGAWQEKARRRYSPEPPNGSGRIRYGLRARDTGAPAPFALVGRARRDALGIPIYSARAKEALFRHYAPIWEVKTRGRADRIGTPVRESASGLRIETKNPTTYTRISFTRFGDEILTQLNYVIWLPARPKTYTLDMLGGFLDGLNYRVTLDAHGLPLLYETVHNCGCYHRLYPTARLLQRKDTGYAEPPLVLPSPDLDPASERMVVFMASRTHYVQHLYGLPRGKPRKGGTYRLKPYERLRSLPRPDGGSRSLFSQNSLVPGSERLERILLWPTGVLSPGAMRQWGRHAVAFVGKRHFDDPRLVERIFRRADKEH